MGRLARGSASRSSTCVINASEESPVIARAAVSTSVRLSGTSSYFPNWSSDQKERSRSSNPSGHSADRHAILIRNLAKPGEAAESSAIDETRPSSISVRKTASSKPSKKTFHTAPCCQERRSAEAENRNVSCVASRTRPSSKVLASSPAYNARSAARLSSLVFPIPGGPSRTKHSRSLRSSKRCDVWGRSFALCCGS